jgi:hypothetical protein
MTQASRQAPRLRSAAVSLAVVGLAACSGSGGTPGGGGAGASLSPVPNSGPPTAIEESRRFVLQEDRAPAGLGPLRLKESEPTPGAEQGWRGGWTTQSLVLSPGQQREGWEWTRSTVDVYEDATTAAHAFDLTSTYIVSTYADESRQTDPGIADESVAVEATHDAPDATVVWRSNNVVAQLAAFGGRPLTNDDIIDLSRRLNAARVP